MEKKIVKAYKHHGGSRADPNEPAAEFRRRYLAADPHHGWLREIKWEELTLEARKIWRKKMRRENG